MNETEISKLKDIIKAKIRSIKNNRYRQEPAYTAALLTKLSDIEYETPELKIRFLSTIVADRGVNSAESIYGADFTLSLEASNIPNYYNKALLGQAKKGQIGKISFDLESQITKMRKHTKHIILLETPVEENDIPLIRIVSNVNQTVLSQRLTLEDYIVDFFLFCLHGDHRPEFFAAVEDSYLKKLKIVISD